MRNNIKNFLINYKNPIFVSLILIIIIAVVDVYVNQKYAEFSRSFLRKETNVSYFTKDKLYSDLSEEKSDIKDINETLYSINNNDDISYFFINNQGKLVGTSSIDSQQGVDKPFEDTLENKHIDSSIKKLINSNQNTKDVIYDDTEQSNFYRLSDIKTQENPTSRGILVSVVDSSAVNQDIYRFKEYSFLISFIIWSLISLSLFLRTRRTNDFVETNLINIGEIKHKKFNKRKVPKYRDGTEEVTSKIIELGNLINDEIIDNSAEKNRLDSILNNMTDGILVINRAGNITMSNPAAFNLLQKHDDLIGMSAVEVLDLKGKMNLREILKSKKAIISDVSDKYQEKIVSIYSSLVRRKSGFISGAVLVVHDVTQQEQVDRERKELISNVSHELKTPLTTINSYIDTLLEGGLDDREISEKFLKVAQGEAKRMSRMITDLLELSRMDQDATNFNIEPVEIEKLLIHIINRFDVVLKTKNDRKLSIVRDFKTGKDLFVNVDVDKFTQVIENIINNAIKYSPEGGKITVSLRQTKNRLVISITDEGLGIPKRDLNKIFDRFYRVDKARSRKQGGSGLGLSISKEVIEKLNGRISADSTDGKGTVFYISLPYETFDEF